MEAAARMNPQCESGYNEISHITSVSINNRLYYSEGNAQASAGSLSVQLMHDLKFDPELLAIIYIVGYPHCSQYLYGAVNLFKESALKGGYNYTRKYSLDLNGAKLAFLTEHDVEHDVQKKQSTGKFRVENFPEEELANETWKVSDIQETFMPSGPGEIASSIDMSWQGASKGELKCHIESVYRFRHTMELNTTQFRFVAINTDKSCPGYYKQHEKNVVIELRGLTGEPTDLIKLD